MLPGGDEGGQGDQTRDIKDQFHSIIAHTCTLERLVIMADIRNETGLVPALKIRFRDKAKQRTDSSIPLKCMILH